MCSKRLFFISTLSLSEALLLCRKKKCSVSVEVIHSHFTKTIHPAYVYLLKGTVFTGQKESLAPQNLCQCPAATPTQCFQNIQILPSLSLCSYSSSCLFFLLSSDFFSLCFLRSKESPNFSTMLFQSPQGCFLPQSPSASNSQYISLLRAVVSYTDMLFLLPRFEDLKHNDQTQFLCFCLLLTADSKCVLIIMMLVICDTKHQNYQL